MDAAQQVMLEIAQELGPDDFGVFFFLGLFGITTVSAAAFVFLSWSWVTAIICVFIGFVVVSFRPPLFICISETDRNRVFD